MQNPLNGPKGVTKSEKAITLNAQFKDYERQMRSNKAKTDYTKDSCYNNPLAGGLSSRRIT